MFYTIEEIIKTEKGQQKTKTNDPQNTALDILEFNFQTHIRQISWICCAIFHEINLGLFLALSTDVKS